MSIVEDRISTLEQEVANLKALEGIRKALSRYAVGVDEKQPEILREIFAEDAVLLVPVWNIDVRGIDAVMDFFNNYWSRFQNPRRYYANEDITVQGSSGEAFTYWHVMQERDGKSVLAWGTYEWGFRVDDKRWKIIKEVVHILVMSTLDRGWAIPDKVMAL
jgi:ketosteroid isomerase-like protein